MRPALMNISIRYTLAAGRPESRVTLETTSRPDILIRRDSRGNLDLSLAGTALAMSSRPILVADGLVQGITVRRDDQEGLRVHIELDYPADYVIRTDPGHPFRTTLSLDRTLISRTFSGKSIALDPGHGGADGGLQGPGGLWERDKCWEIALFTANFLREAGAAVLLTRRPDENPPESVRRTRGRNAQVYLSLHLGGREDSGTRGSSATAIGAALGSLRLAEVIQQAVLHRFSLPDLGIGRQDPDGALSVPAVRIEPITITNQADEELLRSAAFKRSLGLALLGGVRDFLLSLK